MTTTNEITIDGPLERVFALASRVEAWPEILPHYRAVDVLEPGERSRLVSMHCVRDFGPLPFPCRWRAKQELRPEEGKILFEHVGGPTRGMRVEWRLESTPQGVRTVIWHELVPRVPLVGRAYTDWVVGPVFVHAIAGRTLATIKALVEREVRS